MSIDEENELGFHVCVMMIAGLDVIIIGMMVNVSVLLLILMEWTCLLKEVS